MPDMQSVERIKRDLIVWFSLDTVWAAFVPICLLILLNGSAISPHDFWWHLRTGQLIVTEGQIPTADRFSFTCLGQPWINQAWLMQAGFYLAYLAGGLPLIILLHAVSVALGFSLLGLATVQSASTRPTTIALAIGAVLSAPNFAVRPQSLSFVAFGLLIYLVESHRHGKTTRLWWALPLLAVWVNGHGGFVFGIGALGFYVVGRLYEFWRAGLPQTQRKELIRLSLIGLLALAVLGLNPQGFLGIINYVLGFLQSSATTQLNIEFAPLVIRRWYGAFFFFSLVLLVIVMLQSGFRPRADQVLNLLAFGTLALLAQRNLMWFGFVMAPILAAGLQLWWQPPRTHRVGIRWLNACILLLLGLIVVAGLPWFRKSLPVPLKYRDLISSATPVAAMEFLCSTLTDSARIYQYQAFSSYQIWACPRLPVFADTRIELFPAEQWDDYLAIENARFDWERLADKYRLTHLFLSTTFQKPTIQAASTSPHWQQIYSDDRAVIFKRADH